jgi:regulator of protease activity HflC (stomatin/prohibitin superfamily)
LRHGTMLCPARRVEATHENTQTKGGAMNWNYMTNSWEHTRGAVTILEYQRGLLYRDGALQRVLTAGRYRLWPWQRQKIVVLDVRRTSAQVSGQKLLTKDQITITLNLVADYEIADVALALHRVSDFRTQLYEDVQLAARSVVGELAVDELLEQREVVNARLLQSVRDRATAYGVEVSLVAIKDIALSAKVRDMLMKEAEARRTAQAMLIGAREEVAALRALSNAARLAAQHPQLLRLRELDALRSFSQTPGNTVVFGVPGTLPLPAKSAAVSAETNDEEES